MSADLDLSSSRIVRSLIRWAARQRLWMAALAAALAPVTAVIARKLPSGWWWVYAVPVALVFYATMVGHARTRAAESDARNARRDLVKTIQGGMRPLIDTVAAVAAEPSGKRGAMLERVKTAGVAVASNLVGPPNGARACLFGFNEQKALQPVMQFGGAALPRTTFGRDTRRGRQAIEDVVGQDIPLLVRDLAQDPDHSDVADSKPYRSFAAVGVSTRGTSFGMLTVDAEEPESLSDHDVQLLRVIASTMALGFASSYYPDGWSGRQPDDSVADYG